MTFYIFAGSTPETIFVAETAEEALAIAHQQTILGVATTFRDDNGPLTHFEIQAMFVAAAKPATGAGTPRAEPAAQSRRRALDRNR